MAGMMPDECASKEVPPVARRLPPAAGRGRKKGELNKLTRTIKEAIELSFEKVGGADYLARMAVDQPVAYMTLLGKVLPTQISGDVAVIGLPAITISCADEG